MNISAKLWETLLLVNSINTPFAFLRKDLDSFLREIVFKVHFKQKKQNRETQEAIAKSEEDAWLSSIVRFTLLGLFLAMGLSTMGIGENIVNLAFGLILGAVAVAFALSFGLGGREAAGKHMDSFLTGLRKDTATSNGKVTRIVKREQKTS